MKFPLIVLAAVLIVSCGTSHYVNPTDYRKWFAENADKLTDTLTVNNVFFAVREYPYDIDFLNDDRSVDKELKASQDMVRKQKLMRYALRIQLPVPTDIYHYGNAGESVSRAEYFAFHIKDAFKVITKSNDTIPAVRVVVEQAISGYPNSLMLIEFEGLDRKRSAKLIFDDKFLSRSTVKFNVSGFSNSTPPQLSIK